MPSCVDFDTCCDLIINWSEFADDVTLKLSQPKYSFRQVYVVTGVARLEHRGLAIGSKLGAQLETSSEVSDTDMFNQMKHETYRAEKIVDMDTFIQASNQGAYLFKAKKPIFSNEKREHYLRQTIDKNSEQPAEFLVNSLDDDLLDQGEANELNIATCLELFAWTDATLDDAERLYPPR